MGMLSASPKNGAEIMDEIEAMSQGWWRPSPGSIYPLLDAMSQEGLIAKRDDGRYELTERGRQEMDFPFAGPYRRAHSIDEMLNEMSGSISYIEDLNRSDRAKVAPYVERIKSLAERLSQLAR